MERREAVEKDRQVIEEYLVRCKARASEEASYWRGVSHPRPSEVLHALWYEQTALRLDAALEAIEGLCADVLLAECEAAEAKAEEVPA